MCFVGKQIDGMADMHRRLKCATERVTKQVDKYYRQSRKEREVIGGAAEEKLGTCEEKE